MPNLRDNCVLKTKRVKFAHFKHFLPQCIMNSGGMLSGLWAFLPFSSFMFAVSSEVVKGVVRWPPTPGTPILYYIAS